MKFWFVICLTLVGIYKSFGYTASSSVCSQDKSLFHQCQCEIFNPLETHPAAAGRIRCEGKGGLSEANKITKSSSGLIFTELTISSDENVALHTFQYFPHLKNLFLSENKIGSLERDVFREPKHLEILDLSSNEFAEIKKEPFDNLVHLRNLSLADNIIKSIDPDAFRSLTVLVILDLSGNQLEFVETNWFRELKSLLQLSLADNKFEYLEINSFQNLVSLEKLDLSRNKLSTLAENLFIGNKMLEKVNLTGNPWICDERMFPLTDWLKKHEASKEGSLCTEPLHLQNSTLQNGLEILFLEHSIQDNPTCNATMCNCSVSRDKEIISVDCSNRGLTKLPETVPNKTRAINLRGNGIRSLTTDHLDSAKWAGVSFLHLNLNNNLIDSLKGLEGTWLVRNLVALHLTNNQLTEIPVHILEQLRGGLLDELYLSGNPWNCDCNTVRFQTWLQDNYKTVKDFDRIRCSPASGTYSNQPIYRLMKSQLCPQDDNPIHYLDILNTVMAIAIVFIVVKLSYDYWLQKRTGKLPRFFSLNTK